MSRTVIKNTENTVFAGCDFVVQTAAEKKGQPIRILQLTDMQVIDALQRAYPERLRADEISAWHPDNFDAQCGNHIRSLAAQCRPDFIFITGDIVYGSFDNSGSVFEWMCELMDSLEIPWAHVFGNHDNESAKGVAWQCERFENRRYCLFKRGNVSGNGNYTVGIAVGNELIRVVHMLDSNGCGAGKDPAIIKTKGIYPDQLELVRRNTGLITSSQHRSVPAFAAFHIPVDCFKEAETAKGYTDEEGTPYIIGADKPALDGDFGFSLEKYVPIKTDGGFIDFLREQNIDGVFVGHVHNKCTCISYRGIKWVFGLKTGQYDYHIPGQIGGTMITLFGDSYEVNHIPALVKFAPMPGRAPMFADMFASEEG